jgi:hypothetical protein
MQFKFFSNFPQAGVNSCRSIISNTNQNFQVDTAD